MAILNIHVYLIRTKEKAFKKFKIFKAEIENQSNRKIKIYIEQIEEENIFQMNLNPFVKMKA